MEELLHNNPLMRYAAWGLGTIGTLNWFVLGLTSGGTNIITDVLGISGPLLYGLYTIVGAAGTAALLQQLMQKLD